MGCQSDMISQAVSEIKMFENNGHIQEYSPEVTPVGYLFCKNIKDLPISSFVASFFCFVFFNYMAL